MRICLVTSSQIPPREGIGFYCWKLAKELTKLGIEVHIITRGIFKQHDEKIEGIRVWWTSFIPVYPFHTIYQNVFNERVIKQINPDIIHIHTPLVNYPRVKKPCIVTVHTPIKTDSGSIKPKSIYEILIKLQTPISKLIEVECLENATKITCVSHSVAKELRDFYNIPLDEVSVLGNGVDLNDFYPKDINPSNNHSPRYFFSAGRLAPRKGFEDLINCAEIFAKENDKIQFYLAGDGPLRKKLMQMITEKKLINTVILLGHIDDRNLMADYYRNAIAYVHPAHYEGLATVMLEAMACGTKVVTTKVSGALDVIKDGQNGLFVEPHNPNDLSKKLIDLINHEEHYLNLGKEAQKTIEDKYSWKTIARNYYNEYLCLG